MVKTIMDINKYLTEFLLNERAESAQAKENRQKAQADPSPERRKQEVQQVKNYDKSNPGSRNDRDKLRTAKESPSGESAKELEKRGLDLKNEKCAVPGCSNTKVQMDHVEQKTNGKYSKDSKLQWLCKKHHQCKTDMNRAKLGQQENQYGKANPKSESIITSQLVINEAGRAISQETGGHGKVGGKRPKYKPEEEDDSVLVYYKHPQYKDVYKTINRVSNKELIEFLEEINNIPMHKRYTIKTKDGSKDVEGDEKDSETTIFYNFTLIDGTVLEAANYNSKLAIHKIKDYKSDNILNGHVIGYSSDQTPHLKFMMLDHDKPIEINIYELLGRMSENGKPLYRYGRPNIDPVEAIRYYETTDEEGNASKVYEYNLAVPERQGVDILSPQPLKKEKQQASKDPHELATQQLAQQYNLNEKLKESEDKAREELENKRSILSNSQSELETFEKEVKKIGGDEKWVKRRASAIYELWYKNAMKAIKQTFSKAKTKKSELPKNIDWQFEARELDEDLYELTKIKDANPNDPKNKEALIYYLDGVKITSKGSSNLSDYLIPNYRHNIGVVSYKASIPASLVQGPAPLETTKTVKRIVIDGVENQIDTSQITKETSADESYAKKANEIIAKYKESINADLAGLLELGKDEKVEDYKDRLQLHRLSINEYSLSSYSFYEIDQNTGKWPALEEDDVKNEPNRVKIIIPKDKTSLDTVDIYGNVIKMKKKGFEELLAPSTNYDENGVLKPGFKRKFKREETEKVAQQFSKETMSPEETEKLFNKVRQHYSKDPTEKKKSLDNQFMLMITDPTTKSRMMEETIDKWALESAITKYGGPIVWNKNLGMDQEKRQLIKASKDEILKLKSSDGAEFERKWIEKAKVYSRISALNGITKSIGMSKNICLKCEGKGYLKITELSREKSGDLSAAKTGEEITSALKTNIQTTPATKSEFEYFKRNAGRNEPEVVKCSNCYGSGTAPTEGTVELVGGGKRTSIDMDAFNKALAGSLESAVSGIEGADPNLISSTVKALFPDTMKKDIISHMPFSLMKSFIELLTRVNTEYLSGKTTDKDSIPLKSGPKQVVYTMPSASGEKIKFAYNKDDTKRIQSVRSIVDLFRAKRPKNPIYIEAKEDRESYILSQAANLVTYAYDKLHQSERVPDTVKSFKQQYQAMLSGIEPEGLDQYLNGLNSKKKQEILDLIATSNEENISGAINILKIGIKPWSLKGVLEIKDAYILGSSAASGTVDDLAKKLAKLDNIDLEASEIKSGQSESGMHGEKLASREDVNKYVIWAKATYFASNEWPKLDLISVWKELKNNKEKFIEYEGMAMNDGKLIPDNIELKREGDAVIICTDVQTNKEVKLRFNLNSHPSSSVNRVYRPTRSDEPKDIKIGHTGQGRSQETFTRKPKEPPEPKLESLHRRSKNTTSDYTPNDIARFLD